MLSNGTDFKSKGCPRCGQPIGEFCIDYVTELPVAAPHPERVDSVLGNHNRFSRGHIDDKIQVMSRYI